jgi:short-subunit dehydrogenase
VRVVCVQPGPTASDFHDVAGGTHHGRLPLDPTEAVVRAAWRALERGRPSVSTGPVARVSGAAARLAPRRLVVRVAGMLHRDSGRGRDVRVEGVDPTRLGSTGRRTR